MPPDVSGRALVVIRLTIAPGGGFQAHTHPGTLVVSVESGELEYTMLDGGTQTINRAATDATPAAQESVTTGVPTTLGACDWFEEPTGMVHMATNPGSEPTVVLVSGLVDPNQPFVQCQEMPTPTS